MTLIFHSKIENSLEDFIRECWTGIRDSETEGVFKFVSDNSIAYEANKDSRIKDYGETPTTEEDVKYTWSSGEPNHATPPEDYVTLSKQQKFIDQTSTLMFSVLCEIPTPECHESTNFVIYIIKLNFFFCMCRIFLTLDMFVLIFVSVCKTIDKK